MQFNTVTAFATALISAVIAFGLAFYIDRKLSGRMQKKSQRVLTSIAMMSFGYGLMATLNELIGFPLQGLDIRYDKLAVLVVANILILPIILLAIAKLIGLKNKSSIVDSDVHANPAQGNIIKYLLIVAGALSIAYFGYMALEGNASPSNATYDFYTKVDYRNCNSPFEEKPGFSLKFSYKKETNEIFMTAEFWTDGIKKQQINKLDNCSILDAKNWSCGGNFNGPFMAPKYTFVDGELTYENGSPILKDDANCPLKIVRR